MTFIDQYNLSFATYALILHKMKKTVIVMFADYFLFQDINLRIFKVNIAKKAKI